MEGQPTSSREKMITFILIVEFGRYIYIDTLSCFKEIYSFKHKRQTRNKLIKKHKNDKVGTMSIHSQKTMRNIYCRDAWNPAVLECNEKWEFWNGWYWERDRDISVLLRDCAGNYN